MFRVFWSYGSLKPYVWCFIYSPQMPSGLADDNNLPVTHAPAVAVNVAPDEPPTRSEAAEGEARARPHNIKNNLNTMHGQPLCFTTTFERIQARYLIFSCSMIDIVLIK
ncbi:MAG: hypothetical protein J7L38_00190 [Thermoproteales archaeon]|nr:hypothetical protein [Thermoproteales archaeon]